MKYKTLTIKYFDELAPIYDINCWYSKHASKLHKYVLEELENLHFDSILDIGIGTGELLSLILQKFSCNVSGIDISPNMIKIANEKLRNKAELAVGDVKNLIWNKNSFDIIISINAFHHYISPQEALNEMYRVCKINGTLFIGDCWLPTPFRQLYNLLLPSKNGDIKLYSKEEILKLMKKAGFTNIQ